MLAIAHARIYESGEVRDLSLDRLVAEIGRTLVSARPDAARFKLTTVVDPVRADANRAVAFGFLAGEAVSIALDAAPPGRPASISVTLTAAENGDVQLEVSCPEAEASGAQSPAAMRLIEAYARQLDATVSPREPSRIRISAPHAPAE
jgi:two-component sensor histidine kinase